MKPSSAEGAWSAAEIRFPPDHPTAAGHFPGNPILPGALLLDHVLRAMGAAPPLDIQSTKFLAPVRPGDDLTIRWQTQATGAVRFECLTDAGTLAMSGSLKSAAS